MELIPTRFSKNKIVDEKIQATVVAKADEILEKYNLEDIANFIKNMLSNIVQTYTDPDLQEKHTLLRLVLPLRTDIGRK